MDQRQRQRRYRNIPILRISNLVYKTKFIKTKRTRALPGWHVAKRFLRDRLPDERAGNELQGS